MSRLTVVLILCLLPGLSFAETKEQAGAQCDYSKSSDPKADLSKLLLRAVMDCDGLMVDILKNEKSGDLFKATADFTKSLSEAMAVAIKNSQGKTEDDPEAIAFQKNVKSIGLYSEFLKQNCPDETRKSDSCDARKKFIAFGKDLNQKLTTALAAEASAQDADDPEKSHKLKFCSNSNLLAVIFISPKPIETKCLYLLHGQSGRLSVLQSVDGGILVGQHNRALLDKTIFIRTKKAYADGDFLPEIYVKSAGLKKYTSVTGAQKTVNSFEYLGEAPVIAEVP